MNLTRREQAARRSFENELVYRVGAHTYHAAAEADAQFANGFGDKLARDVKMLRTFSGERRTYRVHLVAKNLAVPEAWLAALVEAQ